MRITLLALGLLAAAALLSGAPVTLADSSTEPFFNGKNLTGWEGLTELWSVKNGEIIGETPKDGWKHNTFLCSKQKYKDFELSFEVRLKDGVGNSGVQIRSKILDGENDKGKFVVAGPQCDIGQSYWACLYGEHFDGKEFGKGVMLKKAPEELVKKVLKEKDFNAYSIKCVGKHVTIKLNGETTVDDDFAGIPDEGIIAWQIHQGPFMQVTFKNIKFKDLSKK